MYINVSTDKEYQEDEEKSEGHEVEVQSMEAGRKVVDVMEGLEVVEGATLL